MTADNPIRLTKTRALALADIADAGIDSHIDSLNQMHGVKLNRGDGSIELDEERFELLDSDDQAEIAERVDTIASAIEALTIFRRRYC